MLYCACFSINAEEEHLIDAQEDKEGGIAVGELNRHDLAIFYLEWLREEHLGAHLRLIPCLYYDQLVPL